MENIKITRLDDNILTKNVLAGFYHMDIPLKEECDDKIIFKLYEVYKKGLIYKEKSYIDGKKYVKYYDINTGLEIYLEKTNNYAALDKVFYGINKYISNDSLIKIADRYERNHLEEAKVYNFERYSNKNQESNNEIGLLQLEEMYRKSIQNEEKSLKRNLN